MLNEFSKKEAPIQGLAGMGGGVPSRLLTLASGEITYVDDVFSTFLYDGTGSAQTITNNIDVSGEGALVWIKSRTQTTASHCLYDTERGAGDVIFSNSTSAETTDTSLLSAFTSSGFSLGTGAAVNQNGEDYCSWTFRKCPGFFDVVTYTGTGSARTISHNLGSVPGAIFIKQTNSTRDWCVYHRGVDATNPSHYKLHLNKSDARADEANIFNDTEPTSTVFTVGSDGEVNGNGDTYVAYLFAHNDGSFGEDSDEAVIKCGTYAGSGGVQTISVGFEPQWILIKNRGATYNWVILDMMRVWTEEECIALVANNTAADDDIQSLIDSRPDPNGFTMSSNYDFINKSGNDYIYIAIRRPHKPPEAGTDVFKPELLTSASQTFNPGFAPDMNWHMFERSSSSGFAITGSRLTGNKRYLQTYSSSAESGSGSNWEYDAPTGKFTQGISSGSTSGGIEYFFKRAPGFMDMVAWSGNDSANRAISHNLNAVPELIFAKCRTNTENWMISTDDLITSAEGFFFTNNSKRTGMSAFSSVSAPTSSAFYVGSDSSINGSGRTYLAFIFASLDGISKIGTYTGTGSDGINVDCGFTAGARLVIIKRVDGTGNWFCWDSARGIVSGNDPWLALNGGTEDATTDYIDPLDAGFTVNGSSSAQINTSGGTYQFLAIA